MMNEASPVDWSALSADNVARALATAPRLVAYAWKRSSDDSWVRHDVLEFGCAEAMRIMPTAESGCYKVRTGDNKWSVFPDAEQAKAAADECLLRYGWILSDVPPPEHL